MILRLAKLMAFLPLRLLYGLKVKNGRALRREKCVFCVNHASMLDPLMLNMAMPLHRIWALSSRRLFECPSVCRSFLRHAGAVPACSPAEDMRAMLEISEKLNSMSRIAFFAPGSIKPTSAAFRPGAALLSLKTGLPVVPVYIRIAPFYRGGSIIKVGEPMSPTRYNSSIGADAEKFIEDVRAEMIKLIPVNS